MKKLAIVILILIFNTSLVSAELVRQKNMATYIQFNIWKNDGTLLSGAAGLDSEIDTFADGSVPDGFADCTNEAQEIGSTGQYYLSLEQGEMNADYIVLQIKSSSSGAITRTIKIRTTVGDPLNLATTDDGGTINVTSGKVDEVAVLTGHTAQTGDSYAIVNSGTYGNSAIEGLVDDLETRLTATRAGYLDNLTNLDAAISSRSTLTAANVWETNISAYAGAGYAGTYLKNLYDNQGDWATATGFSTHSAADIWAVETRTITGGTITTVSDKTGYSISGTVTTLDSLKTSLESTIESYAGFGGI